MEIVRKLILVGFLVLVRPGSMLQLVLGMLVSFVFLLAEMHSQPYLDQGDDFLSLFTGARATLYAHTLLPSAHFPFAYLRLQPTCRFR